MKRYRQETKIKKEASRDACLENPSENSSIFKNCANQHKGPKLQRQQTSRREPVTALVVEPVVAQVAGTENQTATDSASKRVATRQRQNIITSSPL